MPRPLHRWIALRRERRNARAKLIALLSLIHDRLPDIGFFDALALIFRADFEAYRERGRSITGLVWWKTADGPMPGHRR